MKVTVLSRKAAKRMMAEGFPENVAGISFYDPKSRRTPIDYEPLSYDGICDRVFYVGIHDIDIEILGDYGLNFETYFPEAPALADFIRRAAEDGCQIICQCEYGQSRSAGVCAALMKWLNGDDSPIFDDPFYKPNMRCYRTVMNAIGKGEEQGE